MKKISHSRKIVIMILGVIFCLAIVLLYLMPSFKRNMYLEGDSAGASGTVLNESKLLRTFSSSSGKEHRRSAIDATRAIDTANPAITIPDTMVETFEKKNRSESTMLSKSLSLPELDSVIIRKRDGTSIIADNIELQLGEDIVFRIPKGTIIERDGVLRVGPLGVQIVDAVGNIEVFPPGHGIGFSYFDKDTSQEKSFDIVSTIEEQQEKKKAAPGCDSINSTIFMLTLLLLACLKKHTKNTENT